MTSFGNAARATTHAPHEQLPVRPAPASLDKIETWVTTVNAVKLERIPTLPHSHFGPMGAKTQLVAYIAHLMGHFPSDVETHYRRKKVNPVEQYGWMPDAVRNVGQAVIRDTTGALGKLIGQCLDETRVPLPKQPRLDA